MTFLAPLGFLAAISIAVLIAIYIIKPNFQQKYISSTFVWKLSLKYKKKRIPTSKLRDILIIISQIAILACCATILAQPSKVLKALVSENEVVIVLDCSASMRAVKDGQSRFERALEQIDEQVRDVLAAGGYVTLIRADDSPKMLLSHLDSDSIAEFNDVMDDFKGELDDISLGFTAMTGCGYGGADMDGALELSEYVLESNPNALVYIYTDNTYLSVPNGINVVDCRSEAGGVGEWNAAVLDATAEFYENYYLFRVKVGAYGSEESGGVATTFDLLLSVTGHNSDGNVISFTQTATVSCANGEEKTIVFRNSSSNSGGSESDVVFENERYIYGVADFSSATAYIASEDCFEEDNVFVIPSDEKPTLRIQYASSLRTPFFVGLLDVLTTQYFKNIWNLKVTTLKPNEMPKTSGFDFYIFEAVTPERLPDDGASLLIACDPLPNGVSLDYSSSKINYNKKMFSLSSSAEGHPLLRNVKPEMIEISQSFILALNNYAGYTSILECSGYPLLAVKNDKEDGERVAVMGFTSQFSNITIQPEFALLIANMINYFHPATIGKSVYSVGETIDINCRGDKVIVYPKPTGGGTFTPDVNNSKTISTFPDKVTVYTYGSYYVDTVMMDNSSLDFSQEIFVRMPASESNINAVIDSLPDPYHGATFEDFFADLVKYVAIALVFFAFAEWFLHIREGI